MIKKNLLQAELIKQNYTFSDVANWLGKSKTAVTRRLNGEVPIDIIEIDIICKKLNLSNDVAAEIFIN